MIVGLTGTNSSGKDSIEGYLIKKGFSSVSLSDYIREETKRRGIEITRPNLQKIGTELRTKYGDGFLAKKALEKLKGNGVVNSIRNPGEIEELRKNKNFILIGFDAPIELRFKFALKRGREKTPQTLEEFKKEEEVEFAKSGHGQQLLECIKMADYKITNDGTIEDLYKKVDKILNL